MTDTKPPRRRATYEDLLKVPDHLVAEIIDGVLYTSPRPAGPHSNAESWLAGELKRPFQYGRNGPGGWWILFEPELHFGQDVLVPDLAGWRRKRLPEGPHATFFTVAPDWVCEVLSPSTARLDRNKKLGVYAREGVAHMWLIDPIAKTLENLRLLPSRAWVNHETFTAVHDRIRAIPFDAIEIELGLVWDDGTELTLDSP